MKKKVMYLRKTRNVLCIQYIFPCPGVADGKERVGEDQHAIHYLRQLHCP